MSTPKHQLEALRSIEDQTWGRYRRAVRGADDVATHAAWHAWNTAKNDLGAARGKPALPHTLLMVDLYNHRCEKMGCELRFTQSGTE